MHGPAVHGPLALAVTKRRDWRNRTEEHRIPCHLMGKAGLQPVALNLHLQQARRAQRRIPASPIEKLDEIRMHLRFSSEHERFEQQPGGATEDLPPQLARLLEDVGSKRLDAPAGVLEPASRQSHRRSCLRRHRHDAVILEPSHGGVSRRRKQRHRVPVGIAGIGSGNRLQQRGHVVDRPSHRSDDAGEREDARARRMMPRGRHAAGGWFQTADAAEMRGHANRSAAVAADAPGRKAGSNRRGFTSAGSAGRSVEGPRTVGAAVERIVGLPGHQLLGDVGDADDDRTRGAKRVRRASHRRRRVRRRGISTPSPMAARSPQRSS